jgi:hypothetical protein
MSELDQTELVIQDLDDLEDRLVVMEPVVEELKAEYVPSAKLQLVMMT